MLTAAAAAAALACGTRRCALAANQGPEPEPEPELAPEPAQAPPPLAAPSAAPPAAAPPPPKRRRLCPQPIFDEPALRAAFERHAIKPVHLRTVWRHLLRHPNTPLGAMPGLPLRAAQLLSGTELVPAEFATLTSTVATKQIAADGTIKLLVRLQDGLEVEAVVMTYDPTTRAQSKQDAAAAGRKGPAPKRATLCVSSQVGCKMGCTFCATGLMGELGQLAAGEILEQLIHANAASPTPITNVVFMGMGEPLNNYPAVVAAVRAMVDPTLFGLAPSKVTISTVGIVPRLHTLDRTSNEGGSSPLLALAPAVSWPWVPACGSLEPSRRDGENAQKTGKNGGEMGEIRSKTREGAGSPALRSARRCPSARRRSRSRRATAAGRRRPAAAGPSARRRRGRRAPRSPPRTRRRPRRAPAAPSPGRAAGTRAPPR